MPLTIEVHEGLEGQVGCCTASSTGGQKKQRSIEKFYSNIESVKAFLLLFPLSLNVPSMRWSSVSADCRSSVSVVLIISKALPAAAEVGIAAGIPAVGTPAAHTPAGGSPEAAAGSPVEDSLLQMGKLSAQQARRASCCSKQ